MVSPVVESTLELVAPAETAGPADAMETPPLTRHLLRISSRLIESTANNGDEKRKIDRPPPWKARETVDETGTIANPLDGKSNGC